MRSFRGVLLYPHTVCCFDAPNTLLYCVGHYVTHAQWDYHRNAKGDPNLSTLVVLPALPRGGDASDDKAAAEDENEVSELDAEAQDMAAAGMGKKGFLGDEGRGGRAPKRVVSDRVTHAQKWKITSTKDYVQFYTVGSSSDVQVNREAIVCTRARACVYTCA